MKNYTTFESLPTKAQLIVNAYEDTLNQEEVTKALDSIGLVIDFEYGEMVSIKDKA